jgi:16S rRNA (cytidine1402-2'-O)-methyltransferase
MTQRRNAAKKKTIRSSGGTKPPHDAGPQARPEPTHSGPRSKPSAVPAGLSIVATPIGNAADITLRALEVLAGVDVIACEDTRVTSKLLAIHGISTSLTAYHEHNAARARPALIQRLKSGQTVALVSDAGTPLVSDPGYKLVRACLDAEIPVTGIPGPSAALTALMVSGLPTDRFLFAGFLPPRTTARRRALTELAAVPASLVLMESARRLAALLADMADILGERETAVTRELTKMFEEVRRGTPAILAAHYRDAGAPKGEVTLVVAPPLAGSSLTDDEVDRRLNEAMRESSVRDAAARVAVETGLAKRALYNRALELRRDRR